MLSALVVIMVKRGNKTYIADVPIPYILDSLIFLLILQRKTSKELAYLRK